MFDSCIIEWNRINQFWTYIFLILLKSLQQGFFFFFFIHIFGKQYHVNNSFKYKLFIKNMSQKEYHTREDWLIHIPKIIVFHGLFQRYIEICNSTLIQVGSFLHLTSLIFRQCPKCIVVILMPKCNQVFNTVHATWHEKQRFIVVHGDTATLNSFKGTHVKRKKMIAGTFWPPNYIYTMYYHILHIWFVGSVFL